MAFGELYNLAEFTGTLDGTQTGASDAVVVYLIDGLTVTKTADKDGWGSGNLTYTIVIENKTGFEYTDVVFTDILEPTIITLLTDTVYLGATKLVLDTDFTYNATTGLLTINRTPKITVPNDQSVTITFQVEKK